MHPQKQRLDITPVLILKPSQTWPWKSSVGIQCSRKLSAGADMAYLAKILSFTVKQAAESHIWFLSQGMVSDKI